MGLGRRLTDERGLHRSRPYAIVANALGGVVPGEVGGHGQDSRLAGATGAIERSHPANAGLAGDARATLAGHEASGCSCRLQPAVDRHRLGAFSRIERCSGRAIAPTDPAEPAPVTKTTLCCMQSAIRLLVKPFAAATQMPAARYLCARLA